MADLYATVTGTTGIISIETDSSYGAITASAVVECDSTSLTLGDAISIDLGYSDDHAVVFDGYVKKVQRVRPSSTVTITANDVLVRAVDYFLASDDQNNPLTYHNIEDRDLVNGLLSQVGLSLTSGAVAPTFTFGTNEDGAKFNLQSLSDAIQFVCNVTGRVCYARNGLIYYVNRYPYVVGGDTPTHFFTTGSAGNIIDINYEESNDKIRNRITVYGFGDLHSTSSGSSPYVVVDQTSVIAHPLLDTQAICDATAAANLTILNRLGRTITLTTTGDAGVYAHSIAQVTESFTGLSAVNCFVYRVGNRLNSDGYVQELVLTA